MSTHRGSAMRGIMIVATALALLTVGCGGSDDGRSAGGSEEGESAASPGAATTVEVALNNYTVTPEPARAPAGNVTFELTARGGGVTAHNFVVMMTDLAPDMLPLNSFGQVDTTGGAEGTEVVGLVPAAFTGEEELIVEVAPGGYVLFCNIADHYQRGMRTGFEVV